MDMSGGVYSTDTGLTGWSARSALSDSYVVTTNPVEVTTQPNYRTASGKCD